MLNRPYLHVYKLKQLSVRPSLKIYMFAVLLPINLVVRVFFLVFLEIQLNFISSYYLF